MRQVLIILMLASTAWAADLQKQLDKAASRFHGKVTLYAINMKTGDTVELNADEPVQTASVIKLPVMVEVFAEVAAGKRSLQDKLVLTMSQTSGSIWILDNVGP